MKILKSISVRKRQVLMLFVVALLGAVGGIIHGIYFDLDISQIKRLSILGIIFTTLIIFPAILFFEYVFDWNNREDMNSMRERIERLEAHLKKLRG